MVKFTLLLPKFTLVSPIPSVFLKHDSLETSESSIKKSTTYFKIPKAEISFWHLQACPE